MNPWDPEEDDNYIQPKGVQTSREARQPSRQMPQRSQRGAKEGADPADRADSLLPRGGGGDADYEASEMLARLLSLMSNKMPSNMYPPSMHPDHMQQNMMPQMPHQLGNMIEDWGGMLPQGYPDGARPVQPTREMPRRK